MGPSWRPFELLCRDRGGTHSCASSGARAGRSNRGRSRTRPSTPSRLPLRAWRQGHTHRCRVVRPWSRTERSEHPPPLDRCRRRPCPLPRGGSCGTFIGYLPVGYLNVEGIDRGHGRHGGGRGRHRRGRRAPTPIGHGRPAHQAAAAAALGAGTRVDDVFTGNGGPRRAHPILMTYWNWCCAASARFAADLAVAGGRGSSTRPDSRLR